MKYKEKAEKAAELKQFHGCNCAQAVAAVLADETSYSEEELKKIASGFAVGMGNMEATCGSLIGAVMIAGIKMDGKGTVRFAKEISQKFQERTGALICKEIKGIETGKIVCSCDDCVRNAVLAYGEVMGSLETSSSQKV